MNLINASRTQQISSVITTATTSTAIPSTSVVVTSAVCPHWIAIGANPVVNASTSFIIPTGAVLEFSCNVGDKVAVIGHAAGGHIGLAY